MKKRILVFSHEFPPMQGGAGTYAYELSIGLNKLGFEVFVLAGNTFAGNQSPELIDSQLISLGIHIKRYNWVERDRLWFFTWKKIFLRYLVENGKFDHIFFANFTSCVIGHKVRQNILTSYSITIHGDDVDYFFTRKKWRSIVLINRKQGNAFFSGARKIICVSHFAEQKLLNNIPFPVNSVVIHHGIEFVDLAEIKASMSTFESETWAKLNMPKEKTTIIYIARLEPKKGQSRYIKLLAENPEIAKKTHTIFIGGGSKEKKLKNEVKEAQLDVMTTFTGEISREEVMKYLYLGDILVFLSRLGETFGLVLLEAMLFGKPVVALRHGGMVEVVEDEKNGFLVGTEDIVPKLNLLIDDRGLREKMGTEGRKLIEARFNNRNMAANTVSRIFE
jgi:L-malate glycosyltransferase